MKRNLSIAIALMFLATASFASAQIGAAPTTDVLGAHLNYGRGCAGCHAPHNGVLGAGGTPYMGTDTGSVALWGEDASHLYGMAIAFAGQTTTSTTSNGITTPASQEVLPSSLGAGTPDVSGILMCLSCHDGNYAKGAMMQNRIYETVPGTYSSQVIPTLLGNNGVSGAEGPSYLTSHPVGLSTVVPCGTASHGWDCTYSTTTPTGGTAAPNGGITPGPYMTQFINNYGWFVSPSNYNSTPVVMCTTCHNQHLMNVVSVTNTAALGLGTYSAPGTGVKSGTSGLPGGFYSTMFFIRAPYNPADSTRGGNQTAQFCRQCHGGESNELNGGKAGTIW